jgi:hypothetical protein
MRVMAGLDAVLQHGIRPGHPLAQSVAQVPTGLVRFGAG